MSAPGSFLIVRLSALGDVIHVLPALSALRRAYPRAKIGWAVEDRAATLLQDQPELDRLHVIPRREWTRWLKAGRGLALFGGLRRSVAAIRREGYEVALDFQANFRSSALTRLSGAPRRIGQPRVFAKEGSPLFFTEAPPAVEPSVHKIERNLQLLRPLGVAPDPVTRGRLAEGGHPELNARLAEAGQAPWVAIHPGVSAFGAIKAWRPERFAQLGARLAAEGATVFFLWGGDAERRQAERLVARAPGCHLAPPTNLAELGWLLRQVQLFVGVDSGPLHLAAALGAPVLGLYGPKHTGTYGPYWPDAALAVADYPCVPCRHRRCPLAESEAGPDGGTLRISPCMDTISVELAHARARQLIQCGRSSA